jgi:hypothetical protein
MRRSGVKTGLALVLLCWLFAFSGCRRNPPSARGDTENLFPLKPGIAWTYEAKLEGLVAGQRLDQNLRMEARLTSVRKQGNRTTGVISTVIDEKPGGDDHYIVTEREVLRARTGPGGQGSLTPPMPILHFPVRVGDAWKWRGRMKLPRGVDADADAKIRVVERKELTTPAGTFPAYRVEMQVRAEAQGMKLEFPAQIWYAPHYGMVQLETTIGVPGGQNLTVKAVLSKFKG